MTLNIIHWPQIYFGHLMWKADSLEKVLYWERLKAGGEEEDRGWDGWMVSPTQWTWIWASSKRWWRTEKPGCCSPWGREESVTSEQLNNRSISLDLPYLYWHLGPCIDTVWCYLKWFIMTHFSSMGYLSWISQTIPHGTDHSVRFFILQHHVPTWLLNSSFWRLNLAGQKESCTNKAMLILLWVLYS